MSDFLAMSRAQRRRRQNQALERLYVAWYAALISASLATFMVLWVAIRDRDWTVLPYLSFVGFTLWLAWVTRHEQSQVAAGALVVNALVAPLARWVQTGSPASLVVATVVIIIYFRAFQATMDLAELRSLETEEQAV